MLPRRIPFNQIAFATLVGVGGGIYIYRPMFEPPRKPTSAPDHQDVQTEKDGQDAGGRETMARQAAGAAHSGAAAEK
ncbi:hypothetical protein MHYP_G00129650 [Metynnis hypsauchen]